MLSLQITPECLAEVPIVRTDRSPTSASDREFRDLILPLSDMLYGRAIRLTRNPVDAEDLVQASLVRAWRFWHTFKANTNARAWVSTILRNEFISNYHRRVREREAMVDLEKQGAMASMASSPEDFASDEATAIQIRTAMARLPEHFREPVILADMEGRSYREIGETLGIPIGTVMSRIYRGRKLLHGLLYRHAAELGMNVRADHR
jgi:RNA polymerase sigma-70 factor (ECF subfamily)